MHLYDLFRWVLAGLFTLLGGWIIVANYAGVIVWYLRGENHSMTPLIGGFLACFGMLACPMPAVEKVAWVPFIVDLGCVFLLVSSIVHLVVVMPVAGLRKRLHRPKAPQDDQGAR